MDIGRSRRRAVLHGLRRGPALASGPLREVALAARRGSTGTRGGDPDLRRRHQPPVEVISGTRDVLARLARRTRRRAAPAAQARGRRPEVTLLPRHWTGSAASPAAPRWPCASCRGCPAPGRGRGSPPPVAGGRYRFMVPWPATGRIRGGRRLCSPATRRASRRDRGLADGCTGHTQARRGGSGAIGRSG